MPLLAILDETAHGALDDSLKPLYVQNAETKQFWLDVAPDEAAKVAVNLQTEKQKLAENNKKLLQEKIDAANKLKSWETFGKTPEEIKALMDANRPEEVTKLVTEYEAKIKSVDESYKDLIAKETGLRETAQRQLLDVAQQTVIEKLRNEFDLNDAAAYVLRDFIRAELTETGEVVTKVYENGEPAMIAGGPKSPEQLLQGFKEQKKFLAIFNAGTGAGTGGNGRQSASNSGGKTMRRSEWEKLDAASSSAFFAAGGTITD